MAQASAIMKATLVFAFATASVTAKTGTSDSGKRVAPAPKERAIQWKLWVGKKTYELAPKGGEAPLPSNIGWRCRYSGAVSERNSRNLREETVTMACSLGSAQFSLSTTCGAPIDPTKPVADGVMTAEFQHAFLGGRTFVGISCDVPGFELRTYRKK